MSRSQAASRMLPIAAPAATIIVSWLPTAAPAW
jgi:hypothetical protein